MTKEVDGKTTQFIWQGDRLIAESAQQQGIRGLAHYRSYLYEPGTFKPLALLDGKGQDAEAYYYQLDHLGTPQELTSRSGHIVWSANYRAYGNVLTLDIADISNPLRFQGQYYDEESGLHYNRHRYYNPNTGRYLTPDPIKLAGGLNSYQYVPNPTGWVDPLGLVCVPGACPGQKDTKHHQHNQEPSHDSAGSPHFYSYEQAANKALNWLLSNDFRAEKTTIGKFGKSSGQPIGMQTIDGKTGCRVEYDQRSGAHINVWSGKQKGPHYLFQGSPELVLKINKRFYKK